MRNVNMLILDETPPTILILLKEWMEEGPWKALTAHNSFEFHITRYFIRKLAKTVCELEEGKLLLFPTEVTRNTAGKQYHNQQKQLEAQKKGARKKNRRPDSRIKNQVQNTGEKLAKT